MPLSPTALTSKHVGMPLARFARARSLRARTPARKPALARARTPWSERDTTKGGW